MLGNFEFVLLHELAHAVIGELKVPVQVKVYMTPPEKMPTEWKNLERDLVVYTGTHDNNTSVGWYQDDASEEERDLVRRYAACSGREVHWDLVRLALAAVCDLAVVPHQDLAGLGSDFRMNTPAVGDGNWRFRITPAMLGEGIQARLFDLIETYGRLPEGRRPPPGPGRWRQTAGPGPPLRAST